MTAGFRVDLGELAAHATAVDGHAGRTAEVAAAAQPLHRDAYGVVGQPFAELAARTTAACADVVASLAGFIGRVGGRLRACAGAYEDTDARVAAEFEVIA